jgi:hypothetical protein
VDRHGWAGPVWKHFAETDAFFHAFITAGEYASPILVFKSSLHWLWTTNLSQAIKRETTNDWQINYF